MMIDDDTLKQLLRTNDALFKLCWSRCGKENRFGWPLRGIIWFTVLIVGSCAVIALLAGYAQKTRSLEKITHRAVTFVVE